MAEKNKNYQKNANTQDKRRNDMARAVFFADSNAISGNYHTK